MGLLSQGQRASVSAATPVLWSIRHASNGELVGHVSLPGGSSPARLAAVWLDNERGEPVEPLTNAVLDQRGKTFLPHVLVVTRGTTVLFPNNDTVFHNVFAYFEAKRFDLGMYPRGAVRPQKFDKAGVVALLCNIHPHMSAYIVVVDTPHYGTTNEGGQFQLAGLTPGSYTLHVWHESGATTTQKVTVGKDGTAAAPLALTLKR